jgi:chemotaxis protein methyltransferase CheR
MNRWIMPAGVAVLRVLPAANKAYGSIHERLPAQISPMPSLSKEGFQKFSEVITRELGIKMPPEKLPMLQSRLQRRLRQLGIRSLEAYQDLLFQTPCGSGEWVEFINLVTTNKTDFFREAGHFDHLTRDVLPRLAPPQGQPWEFKLWCAGCSSGEEPYTLAMVLAEYQRLHSGFHFSILATDISTNVIEAARTAIYDTQKIEPVPLEMRQRYLMRSKDTHSPRVRIVPELRQKVSFGRLNFMDDTYGIRELFDVVFFRNVMIYFSKQTQHEVLGKICRHIRRGGFLFVGHAESILGLDLPLRGVSTSVFQKTA